MTDKVELIKAEIERLKAEQLALFREANDEVSRYDALTKIGAYNQMLSFINSLPEEPSLMYVVTRCEEHSDYVEKVFINKQKAEEYCKPFNNDEDSYHRGITEIKITN